MTLLTFSFTCTARARSSVRLHSSHTVRCSHTRVGSERAVPVAFLPPYGPLLELDGELGLDVGEAVHDALELVEGEAAAAVEVALAHDVVHHVGEHVSRHFPLLSPPSVLEVCASAARHVAVGDGVRSPG